MMINNEQGKSKWGFSKEIGVEKVVHTGAIQVGLGRGSILLNSSPPLHYTDQGPFIYTP